jgi:transposase
LVKQQIKALEAAAQREAVEDGKQPLVAQLAQLRAIGPKGAWVRIRGFVVGHHALRNAHLGGELNLR